MDAVDKSSVPCQYGRHVHGRRPKRLEETPAGILLCAYDDDLQHTARFLVNLGCPFRVLQPPELVGELRRLAESILDMTKSGENQPSDAL